LRALAKKKAIVTYGLGATISNKDGSIDLKAITAIAEQFKTLVFGARRVQIVAVVGTGGLGRSYVQFAKDQITKNKNKLANLDYIAIRASRVNALLLASVLRNFSVLTNAKIPETSSEVEHYLSSGFDCVILGGLDPGMTSDSTAASIAQANGGPLVIVSTVGGIYEGSKQDKGEGRGKRAILEIVDRKYLRRLFLLQSKRERKKEHVLDLKTIKILLDKKSKGMNVLVTGYPNVLKTTRELLSARKKGKQAFIKGATRISV
jgi:uridylate kinase